MCRVIGMVGDSISGKVCGVVGMGKVGGGLHIKESISSKVMSVECWYGKGGR